MVSVLGRAFAEGDDLRLMNFLKTQEKNGGYFTKAMNKDLPAGTRGQKGKPTAQAPDMLPKAGQEMDGGE